VLPWRADRDELISSLTCVSSAEVVGLGPPSITSLSSFVLALISLCQRTLFFPLLWLAARPSTHCLTLVAGHSEGGGEILRI
jgi:hypothetical protein